MGAGPLGASELDDAIAERLIRTAVGELGVTLIDTAPSYGRSERRIGAALRGGLREQVVVSTKLGYGVPGVPDWTGPCISRGIDAALKRLETDWIDIAHLHSCPQEVLERGDVIEALGGAVRAGKLRVAAYSGDNAALAWAIASGRFGAVQCSLNVFDQRALDANIPAAAARGVGVLAKRPLANGVWREAARPAAADRATYWDRMCAMDAGALDGERMLRFVLAQPVACALVGTTSVDHLARAVFAAERGPLDDAAALRAAFQRCDVNRTWDGVI